MTSWTETEGAPIDRFDVERARRETPGAGGVVHLNNAGSALPPAAVLNSVIDHLRLEAELGGYEAADVAEDAVEHTYDAVAALLGCHREEIAIVENATRAWDMAFYSMPFQPGDRILTARAEYASNVIALLQVARRTGAVVEVIPDDQSGQVSVGALENMLDERVRLVAVTHVPTQGGLVNPAAAIGSVTQAAGVPFLLDACQSVGQLPVRVDEIGCDCFRPPGASFYVARVPPGSSMCGASSSSGSNRPFSICTLPSGRRPRGTRSAATRAGSRTGRPTVPPRSGWASLWTTR